MISWSLTVLSLSVRNSLLFPRSFKTGYCCVQLEQHTRFCSTEPMQQLYQFADRMTIIFEQHSTVMFSSTSEFELLHLLRIQSSSTLQSEFFCIISYVGNSCSKAFCPYIARQPTSRIFQPAFISLLISFTRCPLNWKVWHSGEVHSFDGGRIYCSPETKCPFNQVSIQSWVWCKRLLLLSIYRSFNNNNNNNNTRWSQWNKMAGRHIAHVAERTTVGNISTPNNGNLVAFGLNSMRRINQWYRLQWSWCLRL